MPEGRADVLTGTAAVETALSDGVPFGSHSYIAGEVATVYADLLAVLAEESVAAKDLSAALDRMDPASRPSVLRDSLLRRTIEDGVCRTVKGIDTIEPAMLDELVAETASELAAGHRTLLNEHARGAPLGPTSDFGYVWVGEPRDQLPGRRFVDEVTKRVPRFRVQGATPDQVESLSRGVRLATRVAPHLASSALSHSFMVVLGEFEAEEHQRFNSFTLPGLPGVLICPRTSCPATPPRPKPCSTRRSTSSSSTSTTSIPCSRSDSDGDVRRESRRCGTRTTPVEETGRWTGSSPRCTSTSP